MRSSPKKASVLAALVLALIPVGIVLADTVTNDVVVNFTGLHGDTIANGGSTTVDYTLVAQSGEGTDPNNCDATSGQPANVTVVSTNGGVTITPSSFSFTSCGTPAAVTLTSTTAGNHTIDITVTGGKTGSIYHDTPWTLKVGAGPSDTTKPVIAYAISPSSPNGTNGWYTSDVSVTFTCTDNSGSTPTNTVATGNTTLSSDMAGTTVTSAGTCIDPSGNVADPVTTPTIKIDKTAPTSVVLTPTGTIGSNGWYTGDVTLTTTGTDAISGVTCTGVQTQTSDTTGVTFNGSCTNGAGLTTNATPVTVKLDKTGPSASLSVSSGLLGTNGWYTSNVTVSTNGSDISPVTCSPDQSLNTDSTGTVFNGSCTNEAGLSTNASPLTVKRDATAPTVSSAITSGTLGLGGWYVSDVNVQYTCSDATSGVPACPSDLLLTTEGPAVTAPALTVTDAAGNVSDPSLPIIVKIDKTGPSATLSAAGTVGDNDWYTSNVTVSTTGSDISTVTCTADQFQTTDTTGQSFSGSCTNEAGLSTNAAPITVKRDATAPTITASRDVGPNGNGWNNTDVVVSFLCDDATSGVVSCTAPITKGEGAGQSAYGEVYDDAGNSASTTESNINVDKTAPVIAGSASPAPNGAGWNNTNVTVSFLCSDVLSGIATNTVAGATLTTEAPNQSVTNSGACTDLADNSATSATVSPINIDKTAPTVTIATPANGASFLKDSVVNASWSVSDGNSGINNALTTSTSANGAAIATGTTGSFSYSVSATDLAGNTTSVTNSYSVYSYVFGGILAPVNISSKEFKQTSTIPVKFQLKNSITNQPIQGPTATLKVNAVDAVSSGKSNDGNKFRYDTTDKQYIYNLSTKSLSTGSNVLVVSIPGVGTGTFSVTITIK